MEQQVVIQAAPHSVELSRNASGGVSFAVKCYAATPEEALASAKFIYWKLDSDYPAQTKHNAK